MQAAILEAPGRASVREISLPELKPGQVRDVLFVEDLVDAFLLTHENIARLSGQSFNMGGGPDNTISLLELLDLIEAVNGSKPPVNFEDWRSADQRYYV